MNLDLQYIVNAIKALNRASEAIQHGTPEQRGVAAAYCITAAADLEVRIGQVVIGVDGAGVHQSAGSLQ